MDQNLQNKLAWSILAIVIVIFIVFLYIFANANQRIDNSKIIHEPAVQSPAVEKKIIETIPVTKSTSTASQNQEVLNQLKLIYGINNDTNVLGVTKNPRITIVEFGDFTCIHCLASYPVIRNLVNKYQDRIQFIWRDRTPTVRSMGLALSAHCAGQQGKFWEMHDALFQAQSDTLGIDQNELITLAEKININAVQFKECLDNKTYINDIKKNLVDSERLAVSGTPTWYVNGIKYAEGEIDKTNFENYLLELLNN